MEQYDHHSVSKADVWYLAGFVRWKHQVLREAHHPGPHQEGREQGGAVPAAEIGGWTPERLHPQGVVHPF